MNVSTTAEIQPIIRQRWLAESIELISSMRFAISLLSLLAIASVVGTVLKQNEPLPNYVNQFGPFWFEVFRSFSLFSVYGAWWFLLILGFLVLSTALCITRNAPKMLVDMRSWKENVREQSLRNFHHRHEWVVDAPVAMVAIEVASRIAASGYKVKLVDKGAAQLIVAKQGAANKWGYIFAHSAIVVICIGGLLDSDLPIRFQKLFDGKEIFSGSGLIADIGAQHRLGLGNPTFRGNVLIPEGSSSDTAIIQQPGGVLIQDLPITIRLKRFVVDYYSTGMPKLFSSEVTVTDNESGESFPATIKVNQPLLYKGLAVYQSSFEDGGSKLKLIAHKMQGAYQVHYDLAGEVGGSTPLQRAGTDVGGATAGAYTVEFTGFRPFNVENMKASGDLDSHPQDVRGVNLAKGFGQAVSEGLDKRLGNAAKNADSKDLRNVGPSVQYKLRDKTGQAREYHNFMVPTMLDGSNVFLTGTRDTPDGPFRYLRIPADDNASVEEWMRLRAALQNPPLRALAAQRYAQRVVSEVKDGGKLQQQLRQSAERGMSIFAGDNVSAGYVAVSKFLETIAPAEQEKAAGVFMKILNGSLWDLWQAAREKDGLEAVEANEAHARFLQVATNAYADAFFYAAPVYLQLAGFDEIKASVFQVTRSPGKNIVYLGCLLLVVGVFSMLYIRERRVWVWVKSLDGSNPLENPSGQSAAQSVALMAMSSQRKTLDFEQEFDKLKQQLTAPKSPPE